jgi:hypothetical protein
MSGVWSHLVGNDPAELLIPAAWANEAIAKMSPDITQIVINFFIITPFSIVPKSRAKSALPLLVFCTFLKCSSSPQPADKAHANAA